MRVSGPWCDGRNANTLAKPIPFRHHDKVHADREPFLAWVSREHGDSVRAAIEQSLPPQPTLVIQDPGQLVRDALIQLYPEDYEFRPACDVLPYGFCSD